MFDLRAVISTEVLLTTTRGCMWPWSGRYSRPEASDARAHANATFSSSYAPPAPPNAWIRPRKSPPRPMSNVSPAPQLGVAEATGEERC